ncbi:hypothetical protein IKP85_03460 [bacterium]|nr:hypothetical protein [bacterium]
MLKDALTNDIGESEFENIIDSIDIILDKAENSRKVLKNISEDLDESGDYTQVNLLLDEIYSLLKILKYSLKAKRSSVNYEDIFNCLNVISKYSSKLLEYGTLIAKLEDTDRITSLWRD